MNPKRKLKGWVYIVLLSLPVVVIISLLFFIAIYLKQLNREVNVQIHCPGGEKIIWSEQYE